MKAIKYIMSRSPSEIAFEKLSGCKTKKKKKCINKEGKKSRKGVITAFKYKYPGLKLLGTSVVIYTSYVVMYPYVHSTKMRRGFATDVQVCFIYSTWTHRQVTDTQRNTVRVSPNFFFKFFVLTRSFL